MRAFFAGNAHLAPATRARHRASAASFTAWAFRRDLLPSDPMAKLDRIALEPPPPKGLKRAQVRLILASIPGDKKRDRLLFSLVFETGLRISEALGIHIEDLALERDDERLSVLGKGNRRRTVLLDDPALVAQLRAYLKLTGFRTGPLFRAEKNGRGGALRYRSVQELWAKYCERAGVTATIHELRHGHAQELVNGGVSLATIRKRLGYRHIASTMRYAEQADATADAELRAWRRKRA